MGKVKFLLTYSILFCIITFHSHAQIDGIAFEDRTYVATFEHYFGPVKANNGDTTHFLLTDTTNYTFNWIIDGNPMDLQIDRFPNSPGNNNILFYNYLFDQEGSYTVDLEITDTAGYSYNTSQTIVVQDPLEVPNVFTPNGDGQNERFVVKSNGDPDNKIKLTIYSRNGDLIHEQIARVVYWDGKLASGQYASEGVYYYIIETQGTPSRTKKGFFHLFR